MYILFKFIANALSLKGIFNMSDNGEVLWVCNCIIYLQ